MLISKKDYYNELNHQRDELTSELKINRILREEINRLKALLSEYGTKENLGSLKSENAKLSNTIEQLLVEKENLYNKIKEVKLNNEKNDDSYDIIVEENKILEKNIKKIEGKYIMENDINIFYKNLLNEYKILLNNYNKLTEIPNINYQNEIMELNLENDLLKTENENLISKYRSLVSEKESLKKVINEIEKIIIKKIKVGH